MYIAPVGLFGVLIRIARVFGVTAASISAARGWKPSSRVAFDDGEIGARGTERTRIGRIVGRHHDGVVALVERRLHGGVERRLSARG